MGLQSDEDGWLNIGSKMRSVVPGDCLANGFGALV